MTARARRAVLHALAVYGPARRQDISNRLAPELRDHLRAALAALEAEQLVFKQDRRYHRSRRP